MPKEYLDSIRKLIHKLIVPFNGGAYTYESLVCWTKLFSIKPSLKDLWAYNAALLAARSPILHSRLNYWKLPKLEVVISKSISNHRDAAAVDFWRGRHAFDGTLIPLSDFSSPFLYNSLVEDEYLDTAMNHTGNKISKFLARKSLFAATDAEGCMLALAHNMALARKVPRPYTVYHFTLVNNAVATERRKRHQFGVERQRVAFCSYCGTDDESIEHWLERCGIIRRARASLFARIGIVYGAEKDTLSFSYLVSDKFPLSTNMAVLALNYAIWNYREAARSTRGIVTVAYLIDRLIELSIRLYDQWSRPKKPKNCAGGFDPIESHDVQLRELVDRDTLVYYNDGSASPNPGPSGAGVVLFVLAGELTTEIGLPLRHGTNNLGEIMALYLALNHAVKYSKDKRIIIFSDSRYALNSITKRPKSPLSK